MSRRRKPHDPAAAERERAATKAEVERLAGMGAEVNLGPDGKIRSAWRSNVFTVLLRSHGEGSRGQRDARSSSTAGLALPNW